MSKLLYQRECAFCGKPFTASRIDAKYCSPKCGQAAFQQVKREERGEEQPTPQTLGATPALKSPKKEKTEPQKEKSNSKDFSQTFDGITLSPIKQPDTQKAELKQLIKDSIREVVREEISHARLQQQRNITVKHDDTGVGLLNLIATGTNMIFNKSDNNDIKQQLAMLANGQNNLMKVINAVLMDVKALKRVCKIFHITAEYSPKYGTYLFCYRKDNYIIKEDVNGNIIARIPLTQK